MTSWQNKLLYECVDILDNKRIPVNNKERLSKIEGKTKEDLVPYYGATGQVGYIDDYLCNEELVLLGEDGAPFLDPIKPKAYIIYGKSWVNNHAHILRGKSGVLLNKFLLYQLNSIKYPPYVSGTTRLKLPQGQMKQIPILLPSLPEQKRIVAKIEELFTRLDAGVENLRKTKQLLKNYRQAVLRDAFTGNLTGKVNHKDTKAPRELPDGWEWKPLGDLISEGPQNGFYTHKSNYGSGVPILRIDDYQIGSHRSFDEIQKVNIAPDIIERYKLEENDLVINRVNSPSHLGKSLVIPATMSGAIFESNMMKMKLSKRIQPKYVYWFLSSTAGRESLTQNAKWAVNQASINQQDVKATLIPLALFDEQNKIVLEIERHFSIADAVEKEIDEALRKTDSLRQSILKSAFEGELVKESISHEGTKAQSIEYPECEPKNKLMAAEKTVKYECKRKQKKF